MGVANSRKASTGLLAGLQDPRLMASKKASEDALRGEGRRRSCQGRRVGSGVGSRRPGPQAAHKEFLHERQVFEGLVRGSTLLSQAMHFVRLADELKKPDAERLREYKQAGLEQVLLPPVFARADPRRPRDARALAVQLSRLCEQFGAEHATVALLLAGKGPAERAAELVKGCTFKDPAARKARWWKEAERPSRRPMIRCWRWPPRSIRCFVGCGLATRTRSRASSDRPMPRSPRRDSPSTATASIPTPPSRCDCRTASSRRCRASPPSRTSGACSRRAAERGNEGEFRLPPSWEAAREKLDLKTPFNFVCTADIIGGNSGSPVVNAKGEVVGLISDGNIDSLVGDVAYDERRPAQVSVDSRGMIEAFEKVYGAKELVSELTPKRVW
jgi:hypothetical protein